MTYWDLTPEQRKEVEARGVDYDLQSCLDFNIPEIEFTDIIKVLAVWEGENDEDDWRWIVHVSEQCATKNGGEFAFIQGGCDYTGWDCQSDGKAIFVHTTDEALAECLKFQSWRSNEGPVYDKLAAQIATTKYVTWREQTKDDLGFGDLPKVK